MNEKTRYRVWLSGILFLLVGLFSSCHPASDDMLRLKRQADENLSLAIGYLSRQQTDSLRDMLLYI